MEFEQRRFLRTPPHNRHLSPGHCAARGSHLRRSMDAAARILGIKSSDKEAPNNVVTRDRAESIAAGLLLAFRRRTSRRYTTVGIEEEFDPESYLTDPADADRRQARANHMKLLRERQRRLLYERFRRVAKLAIVCGRLTEEQHLRTSSQDSLTPFLSGVHFHDTDRDSRHLLFDPRKFKADKELRVSEEARRILTLPPWSRTDKDLHYAQVVLRNNPCFAEYPVRMQEKLTRVARYERFDARRVIVRQGHRASAFYFILSGSVVVLVGDEETKATKPVAFMHRNMTFGELAIINRTIRQATIVAKETVELLSVDIEDFHCIFMSGGVKNITDPDHLEFMGGLDFLKGWPIEIMADNPEQCIFHFFKRGETLVKDSNFSDWVYVVKSGSIKVLKKLKRAQPRLHRPQDSNHKSTWRSGKQLREAREMREAQRRNILPDLRIPLLHPNDDAINQVLHLPDITLANSGFVSKGVYKSPRQSIMCKSLRQQRGKLGEGVEIAVECGVDEVQSEEEEGAKCDGDSVTARSHDDGETSETAPGSVRKPHQKRKVATKSAPLTVLSDRSDVTHPDNHTVSSQARSKRSKKKTWQDEVAEEESKEMGGRQQYIRKITHDFDAKYNTKDADDVTEADLDPQFVHVQTLTKGQVFGVAETVLGKQPSFCVISNGAECVMIDKTFYQQNASEDVIHRTRQSCCPYPSDEEMQAGLQASVDWEAYKSLTFRNTVRQIKPAPTRLAQW